MKHNYVGVDPGLTGAIACVNEKGDLLWVKDMPLDSSRYYDVISIFDALQDSDKAISAIALENTKRWSKLAQGYGVLYALATLAMNTPPMLVTPIAWQRHHGIKKADKRTSLKRVRNRWPKTTEFKLYKHHDRAEAALLALYIRDKMEER